MARNEIGLDQIQSRLGDLARPPKSYDEVDGQAQFDDGQEADARSSSNTGFIASILGMFLLVSGGTYFFAGSGNPLNGFSGLPDHYSSKADFACRSGWFKGARNDEAMLCYLTKDIERLCDANERKYLVNRLALYREDRNASESKVMASNVKSIFSLSGSLSGIFTDISKNMDSISRFNASESHSSNVNEYVQQSRNEDRAMGDLMKSSQQLTDSITSGGFGFGSMLGGGASKRGGPAPDGSISQAIRRLGALGYVTKWDFGLLPDSLASRAFADMADQPGNICKR